MRSKRLIALCLLLWPLFAAAQAEGVSLPGTGLTLELASDVDSYQIDEDSTCTADWAITLSDGAEAELQVYVFPSGGLTLQDLLELEQTQNEEDGYYSAIDGTAVAGVEAIHLVRTAEYFEQEWQCVSYILPDGENFVQLTFWYTGDEALTLSLLMDTLRFAAEDTAEATETPAETARGSYVSGQTELGDSGIWLTLPADTWSDPLGEEDTANDMVACWFVDDLEIQAYVYTSDSTLAEMAAAFRGDEAYTSCTELTLADCEALSFRMDTVSGGESWSCIGYLLQTENSFVELAFWYPGEEPPAQLAAMVQSLCQK